MNVFVLNTGRCGSSTFIHACRHISNFTAGHESNIHCIGKARLDYPAQHIEADNRLSWILGRLEEKFGDNAFYVHLRRNPKDAARSFSLRMNFGIMKSYREGVLLGGQPGQADLQIAEDYIQTAESNICTFLKDKSHKMNFQLEQAKPDFRSFWKNIDAEGDLTAALKEWDTSYNASLPDVPG
jgi:hypothetical protein